MEAGVCVYNWGNPEKESAMSTIIFNNKTYNSLEEMPANERQAYEQMMGMFMDKNGNGIPDFLEGDLVQNVLSAHSNKMHINVNGQTYHTLEDLPPELRQSVDGAFNMLATMGLIPKTTPQAFPQTDGIPVQESQPAASKPFLASQPSSVIEEDRGTGIFSIVIIGVLLCFGLASASIAIFYFMSR